MNCLEFQHEAMATTFVVTIADQTARYAQQAATAAWHELDRLEGELSRYVESSDIARANRIAHGESLIVGDDTLECLLLAADIALVTQRAFDPAYGSQRFPEQSPDEPPFTLDPAAHALTSRVPRLQLDLGAIGKGFALDRIRALLVDWGITAACLQSGGSTALVMDPPAGHVGWAIGIGEDETHRSLTLREAALSASGIAVKGHHLLDPRTGRAATRLERTWALAPSAAVSDALSTAFFVWTDEEVSAFCDGREEIGAAVTTADKTLRLFGALERCPIE
jgi:thiamine biosynthesis lipoprotein